MVLECFTWIPLLCGQLIGFLNSFHEKQVARPLPDDIIINILSRLPADNVLKLRSVCRQWQELTSTPYFAKLHLKRGTTRGLFVQSLTQVLYFVEDKNEDKMLRGVGSTIKMGSSELRPLLVGSCDGLLLFSDNTPTNRFYIFNPVLRKQLTVNKVIPPGFACGMYFNPRANVHEVLFVFRQGRCYQYAIWTMELNLCRIVYSCSSKPSNSPPAIVNGALHWMVGDDCEHAAGFPPCKKEIMAFRIETEKFCVMPHPGNRCPPLRSERKMSLFEMKGHLSFCDLRRSNKTVEVWVLEDYAKWAWMRRYNINLAPSNHWAGNGNGAIRLLEIRLLDIYNDVLLFDCWDAGLFQYHLQHHTIKKVAEKVQGHSKSLRYLHGCVTIYTQSFILPRFYLR